MQSISAVIKEIESGVDEQLREGRRIRERRADLERLMHIIHCVEKIEKLLKVSKKQDPFGRESSLKGDVVERIASELNQLHFHVAKAQGMDLMSSIQPVGELARCHPILCTIGIGVMAKRELAS